MIIEFLEDLEDIILYLGEDAKLNDFNGKEDVAYISFKNYDFLITEYEDINDLDIDSIYFSCDVIQYGFLIENPSITKFYKDKKFKKDELSFFIKEFHKKIDFFKKTMIIEDLELFFKTFNKKKFKLRGINYSYWSNYIELSKWYGKEKIKKVQKKEILYISNEREFYRLEFYTSLGINDNQEEVLFGNLEIQKLEKKDFPTNFNLVSWANDYILYLDDFGKNNISFSLSSKENDFDLTKFVSYIKNISNIKDLERTGLNYSKDDLCFYFLKGNNEINKEIIKK